MEDKTIIRLGELACGGLALFLHAYYGVDTILILLVCVLWGIPLDIVIDAIRRQKQK